MQEYLSRVLYYGCGRFRVEGAGPVKHRVTGLGRSCSIETPLTLPRTGFDTRQAKTLDISESR